MNDILCQREAATLAAARGGGWTDELREHARLCPDCAAALAVDGAMLDHAADLAALAALPSPESLLWRARFQQRIARAEQLARPIVIFDRLAVGVAVAAVAGGLAWKANVLGAWLAGALGHRAGNTPELAALLLITLGFAGAVAWMFTTWAEE